MAKQIIYKHYQRILTQWPVDPLRPDLSFQKIMQRRVDARLKPASPDGPSDKNIAGNEAHVMVPPPSKFDEKAELEQVNVLYSFLENRYTKKYPLLEKTMRPASNPNYYDDLIKELEEAPTRSRWRAMLNRWKGFIRFS